MTRSAYNTAYYKPFRVHILSTIQTNTFYIQCECTLTTLPPPPPPGTIVLPKKERSGTTQLVYQTPNLKDEPTPDPTSLTRRQNPTQKQEQSGVRQRHPTGYVGGTENNEHTLPTINPCQNYMPMTPPGINRQVP